MSNFKVQNNLLYKLKSHYLQLNDNDTPLPPSPGVPESSGSAAWECCVAMKRCGGRMVQDAIVRR